MEVAGVAFAWSRTRYALWCEGRPRVREEIYTVWQILIVGVPIVYIFSMEYEYQLSSRVDS